MPVEEHFLALEKQRKRFVLAILAALAVEAAGAILLFAGQRAAGLILAAAGLIAWALFGGIGKRRYQQGCAEFGAVYGLGLQNARTVDKKEAAALRAYSERFIPTACEGDSPMFMHTMEGTLNGLPVTLSEATQGFHEPGARARRFLVGTMLVLPAASERELLILCGKPYGGEQPVKGLTPLDRLDTKGHAFLAFGDGEIDWTEEQLTILDGLSQEECKSAIFSLQDGKLTAFFPLRFYSGNAKLTSGATADTLKKDPIPEAKQAVRFAKSF